MKTFSIAGRLGQDLKLETQDETTWTRLYVATDPDEPQWFWITAFGKLAKAMVDHLAKGDGVAISGDLRITTYKGEERVELIARWADFFGKCG